MKKATNSTKKVSSSLIYFFASDLSLKKNLSFISGKAVVCLHELRISLLDVYKVRHNLKSSHRVSPYLCGTIAGSYRLRVREVNEEENRGICIFR